MVSPGDASRLVAIPLLAMAAVYIPAVWVSLFPSPRRQPVQRWVLSITLAMVVVGVFVDAAFATLLLIPSTLLAIAAGLVFQGPAKAKR